MEVTLKKDKDIGLSGVIRSNEEIHLLTRTNPLWRSKAPKTANGKPFDKHCDSKKFGNGNSESDLRWMARSVHGCDGRGTQQTHSERQYHALPAELKAC